MGYRSSHFHPIFQILLSSKAPTTFLSSFPRTPTRTRGMWSTHWGLRMAFVVVLQYFLKIILEITSSVVRENVLPVRRCTIVPHVGLQFTSQNFQGCGLTLLLPRRTANTQWIVGQKPQDLGCEVPNLQPTSRDERVRQLLRTEVAFWQGRVTSR